MNAVPFQFKKRSPIAIDAAFMGRELLLCTLHAVRVCMHAEHIGALLGTKRYAHHGYVTGESHDFITHHATYIVRIYVGATSYSSPHLSQ